MRTLGRFVVGTLGAFCLVWLAVFAYGQLVAHLLITRNWWRASAVIEYGFEILVFVPFAVVIALLSRRLFPRRAAASAFACTLAAVAVLFLPTAVGSYDLLLWNLKGNAEFILTFVVGVPLLVLAMQRWRARPS
jgi:hypothetical protein